MKKKRSVFWEPYEVKKLPGAMLMFEDGTTSKEQLREQFKNRSYGAIRAGS